jgi:hypothetical protein
MSFWTDLRDTVESAAVVAGNYFLPGSSLLTSKLTSEGSQNQLNSTVGQIAQLGSGGAGAVAGNLSNYATAYDKVASAVGGAVGGSTTPQLTGQALVDAANAGTISADEFATLAAGSGTTPSALMSGVGLSQYLMPAASVASGLLGYAGASKAAGISADASANALELQRQMYNQQTSLNDPYRTAGLTAQNALMQKLGLGGNTGAADYGQYAKDFSMADYQADPGYAFRLSEGMKQLGHTAASRGGAISGGTMKGIQDYAQSSASQEYQNAYNRYQQNRTNQLQPLGNLMAAGQTAANQQGTQAGAYGTNAGNVITNAGNTAGSAVLGGATTLGNALNTGATAYQNQTNFNNWLAMQKPA